MVIWKSAAWE